MRVQEGVPRRWPLRDRWKARRFQDATDRGAPDTMADVLQCALNPRVAPRGILGRHPYDEPLNLRHDAAPLRLAAVCPFPSNQLPMPAWRGNRGDLSQGGTAHPMRP